jgi:hypothetical protein
MTWGRRVWGGEGYLNQVAGQCVVEEGGKDTGQGGAWWVWAEQHGT